MEEITVKKGDILIAEPFTHEVEFKRSLVLIADHSEKDGTVGFVINKTLDVKVDSLIVGFPEFNDFVYYGGPVANDTLHYIHTKGDLIEGSLHIKDNLYWSGDFEKIKFLIKSGVITSLDIRFYVGYTGWSAGQLRDELEWGTWFMDKADPNHIFNDGKSDLWKKVLENKGNTYSILAQLPKIINWN